MVVPSYALSNRSRNKRKPANPTDTTESSESGNVRKKVRWDGEITEQDEETDDTSDECAILEKVRVPEFVEGGVI